MQKPDTLEKYEIIDQHGRSMGDFSFSSKDGATTDWHVDSLDAQSALELRLVHSGNS